MLEKTSWKAPSGVLESLNDFNNKYGKALIKALINDGNKSIEQVIEEFTRKKADIDYIDKDGKSALFWACHKNQEEIIEVLLNANADPNICSDKENSPLMEASERGHSNIVRKLLKKKADVNLQDYDADSVSETIQTTLTPNGNRLNVTLSSSSTSLSISTTVVPQAQGMCP